MRTRRLMTTVAASTLLMALTACGGDGDPADEAGDKAPASAEPESSAAPETTDEPGSTAGAAGGYDAEELLAALKAGIEDQDSVHVVIESGVAGQTVSGEGDISYAGESTAMQMKLASPEMGGTLEVRLVDETIYLAAPPTTPRGKFIAVDATNPNSPLGDLSGLTSGDPLSTFEAFDAGLEEAEYVGEEKVAGEELDHYLLTVDAAAAARAQGREDQTGQLPETLTYDLWIDESDLMRRVEVEVGGTVSAVTMTGWGEDVDIVAPAPGDLVQMPQLPTG